MGKRSKGKGKRKDRKKQRDAIDAGLVGVVTPVVPATELAARLANITTVMQRLLARSEADGLTRARLSALALLVLGGPRRLGQLAETEGVRPPTMTRLVHAMEADGIVERRPDPDDGRSVIIAATPAGESLLEVGRARQIGPLAEAIERLSADDRETLARSSDVLGRLLRAVERE